MREEILTKHLKNFVFESVEIKDAFIMSSEGLLVADIKKNEENLQIAAKMAGVIEASKRIKERVPDSISVAISKKTILTAPLTEDFFIVLIGTTKLNPSEALDLIEKNRENILIMLEKREFTDLFSYNPSQIKGLDI